MFMTDGSPTILRSVRQTSTPVNTPSPPLSSSSLPSVPFDVTAANKDDRKYFSMTSHPPQYDGQLLLKMIYDRVLTYPSSQPSQSLHPACLRPPPTWPTPPASVHDPAGHGLSPPTPFLFDHFRQLAPSLPTDLLKVPAVDAKTALPPAYFVAQWGAESAWLPTSSPSRPSPVRFRPYVITNNR